MSEERNGWPFRAGLASLKLMKLRYEDIRLTAKQELLILCARIGYNP